MSSIDNSMPEGGARERTQRRTPVYSEDSYSYFMQSIADFEVLPGEVQDQLVRVAQQGEREEATASEQAAAQEASDALVQHNLKFVAWMAGKPAYRNLPTGVERQDIIQEGTLGLYDAISAYDESNAASFLTFSKACIRNRIDDCITKKGYLVRPPYNRTHELLTELRTGLVERDELEGYQQRIIQTMNPLYMSAPLGGEDNDGEWGDNMESEDFPDPEAAALQELERQAVIQALADVPELKRDAVIGRFGLGDCNPRKDTEVATLEGVTSAAIQARVSSAKKILAENDTLWAFHEDS